VTERCRQCGRFTGAAICQYNIKSRDGTCMYYTQGAADDKYGKSMMLAIDAGIPSCILELVVTDNVADTYYNIQLVYQAVTEINRRGTSNE